MEYDGDIEADIMATFEISYESFGSTVMQELVKDGKNVTVNKENREVGICGFLFWSSESYHLWKIPFNQIKRFGSILYFYIVVPNESSVSRLL